MGLRIYPTCGILAAPCPQIMHTVGVELFGGKAKFLQHAADQFLAAGVLGCDGDPAYQRLGQLKD